MKERERKGNSQTLMEIVDRKELVHRIIEIDNNKETKYIQIYEKGLIV